MPKPQRKHTDLNFKSNTSCQSGQKTKHCKNMPQTTKKNTTVTALPNSTSKQSIVLALLQRPGGTTIEEIAKSTGWQRHSVHGMMSGVLRKKLGLSIISKKEERGRIYFITDNANRS